MYSNNNIFQNENQDTNSVKIKEVRPHQAQPREIPDYEYITAKIEGKNYIEVLSTEKKPIATVQKIDKNTYRVVSTGETKEYSKIKTADPVKDISNLRKTFNRLRALIRTNFDGGDNQLFITLTYRENMQDPKKLMKDFNKFMKRLKYKFNNHKLEYIVVAEPQGRKAWHLHLLLKSTNQKVLYIDNKVLEDIWRNGYTKCKRLKSDEVGAYYVAYFTDLLIDETNNNVKSNSKNIKTTSTNKKAIKGGRLKLYPKGFKFYRTSRGIKKPSKISIPYGELKAKGYERKYQNAYTIDETIETITPEKTETTQRQINFIQKEVWKKPKDKTKNSKTLSLKDKNTTNKANNLKKADNLNNSISKTNKHNNVLKDNDVKQISLTDYFDCKKLGTLQSWA